MTCPARLLEFDTSTPDPSTYGLTDSLNGSLLEALLRHRHWLLMAENGVVRDVVQPLRDAKRTIAGELARLAEKETAEGALENFSKFNQKRLRVMENRFDEIIRVAETDTLKELERGLTGVAEREVEIQSNILTRAFPTEVTEFMGLDFAGPSPDQLRAIVHSPLGGQVWNQRMRQNFGEMLGQVKSDLSTSVALGEGIGDAQRRLRRTVDDLGVNRATLIARSEIQRTAGAAAERVYERNKSVLKGSRWVATLDSRTCIICASRDGEVFPVGSGPKPVTGSHAGCRCFRAPVTKSFEELGLPAQDFSASTRASMDGQVPAELNYTDWFNNQPESFQREVLGQGRFERFREGGIELEQMAKNQRVIPLDELPERSVGGA